MPIPMASESSRNAKESLRESVEEAFSFVSTKEREWALEFLLAYNSDAAGDVSGLSNSVSYSQGSATMCFSVVSPDPSSADPTEIAPQQGKVGEESPPGTLAYEVNFLSVPVWQAAGVCVGISILQFVGRHGKSNKFLRLPGGRGQEPRAIGIGRFAREEATGATTRVFVTQASSNREESAASLQRVVHVTHVKFTGTQHKKRFVVQADLASLANLPKRPSSFAEAGLMVKTTRQARACPICLKPPTTLCSCQLNFQRGTGGLDFRLFRTNSALLHGTFSGSTFSRYRAAIDEGFRVSNMISESTFGAREGGGCFDQLSIALRNIAIQQRVSSSANIHRGLPHFETNEPDTEKAYPAVGSTSLEPFPAGETATPNLYKVDEAVLFNLSSAFESGTSKFPFLAVGDTNESGRVSMPNFLNVSFDPLGDSQATRTLHGEGKGAAGLLEREPVVADHSIDPTNFISSEEEWLEAGIEDNVKEHRRVERVNRNRAAAARSNQKRKERRIELLENVEAARSRKEELQNRHDALLEENNAMKARLGLIAVPDEKPTEQKSS